MKSASKEWRIYRRDGEVCLEYDGKPCLVFDHSEPKLSETTQTFPHIASTRPQPPANNVVY